VTEDEEVPAKKKVTEDEEVPAKKKKPVDDDDLEFRN
jgi:hypothetical protein